MARSEPKGTLAQDYYRFGEPTSLLRELRLVLNNPDYEPEMRDGYIVLTTVAAVVIERQRREEIAITFREISCALLNALECGKDMDAFELILWEEVCMKLPECVESIRRASIRLAKQKAGAEMHREMLAEHDREFIELCRDYAPKES